MSEFTEIVALVEGRTEKIFLADLVVPFLAANGVYLTPIVISKPGPKGGDVRFSRVKNDIGLHLKQREDTYLTTFVDFYGIKGDWPGLSEAKQQHDPVDKAAVINSATRLKVEELFGKKGVGRRFIPYFAMHEFEALLFSGPDKLAAALHVSRSRIDKILVDCGGPEKIDDSPENAPSKRIKKLSPGFRKTSTGIAVAKAIGLGEIRNRCPVFNGWLTTLEDLKGMSHG